MKKESMLYGIIGLLAGSLLTIFMAASAVNNNSTGMMRMMGMRAQEQNMMQEKEDEMHGGGMDMSINEMTESLKGKTEDAFDNAFIDAMIDHHQGAIEMAKEAKVNAKHDEIKSLADDIISAQNKEIEMMMDWQKTWGY